MTFLEKIILAIQAFTLLMLTVSQFFLARSVLRISREQRDTRPRLGQISEWKRTEERRTDA